MSLFISPCMNKRPIVNRKTNTDNAYEHQSRESAKCDTSCRLTLLHRRESLMRDTSCSKCLPPSKESVTHDNRCKLV